MRVDSHQHFWRYSPDQYPWIQPDWSIRRDFLPADLAPELKRCQMDGCVAVQARQTFEETRWLLELAEASPMILGVVGWVDLRSSKVEEQLAEVAGHPRLVGVRHVVQDEPDLRFMLRDDFMRGIAKLRPFGLTYDILIFPQQLPAAIELVSAFPDQPFVLDHIAKPRIREKIFSPWREDIEKLAGRANVTCKVSGLVTEAHWQTWEPNDLRPYLDIVCEAFGPDRLMFGSDWPVALLAAGYDRVFNLVADYLAPRGKETIAKVLGLNAARFYNL